MSTKTEPAALRFLRFLGKVQFTMVLLIFGVVAMIVGTLIESSTSRAFAQSWVYRTAWFDLFLFLIAVNLIVAVINRIPIKRHQWAFVLTHFSIVLLLFGGWVSRTFGYEGRMAVQEGTESRTLFLDRSHLDLRWKPLKGKPYHEILELPDTVRLAGITLLEEEEGHPGLSIERFLEDGTPYVHLTDAGVEGSPGIQFQLSGMGVEGRQWLIADHADFRRKDVGPVEIEFLVIRDPEALKGRLPERKTGGSSIRVLVSEKGSPLDLPLPASLGKVVQAGEGISVKVLSFMPEAKIVQGKLRNVPGSGSNPAAVVEVRGKSHTEIHKVFANFPTFNSIRGQKGAPLVQRIRLEANSAGKKPLVSILHDGGKRFWIQLSASIGRGPALEIIEGQTIAVGNLGLDFKLERFVKSAKAEVRVESSKKGKETNRAFLKLKAHWKGKENTFWIGRGWDDEIGLEGGSLLFAYKRSTKELPFSLELEDFILEFYPGSRRPKTYASKVKVTPHGIDEEPIETVISMNRPLDYGGFRLFQSSYQLGERGGPDMTILSVSKDPGVPIVYPSFFLIILGIAWYLRGHGKPRRPGIDGPEPMNRKESVTNMEKNPAQEATNMGHTATKGALTGFWFLAAVLLSSVPAKASGGPTGMPVEKTKAWAIQSSGRIKPLLTFANEFATAITGHRKHDGLSSLELLWGYNLAPEDFRNRPYIRIDSKELKALMELEEGKKRFSFLRLMMHPRFQEVAGRAITKDRNHEDLTKIEKDALEVYRRLELLSGILRGTSLRIVPVKDSQGKWETPNDFKDAKSDLQKRIFAGFIRMSKAWRDKDPQDFGKAAEELTGILREAGPETYPPEEALSLEIFYEEFEAFGKAWKAYLLSFLLILFFGFVKNRKGYWAGMTALILGFAAHTTGIGLRWAIAERAPVSDMYESLVFMGWGTIAIGLFLEFLYRKRFFGLVASLMGFLCLLFSEHLPLDSSINPLVPVLAHTYWLSVHVMTIMLAYSAFALNMGLGHIVIWVQLFRPGRTEMLRTLTNLTYKTMQVGLLFLAAGIVFGAIWANESWGRYWGWDPKETWSLITFFVYLGIVHARFAGWLHPFGLAVSSIASFLSVVMTYYGVNFVLAAGLHSYGSSEGGLLYAALFCIFEIAVIVLSYLRYRSAIRPKLELTP